MTTAALLTIVLSRTVTRQVGDVITYYHQTLPRHALLFCDPDGTPMKWNTCLGFYRLDSSEDDKNIPTISLSTIGLVHQMSLEKIPVVLDNKHGHINKFLASKYDYWTVVALKIHCVTLIPVNLIRLFLRGIEIEFSRIIGDFNSSKNGIVNLDYSLLKHDYDARYGVKFTFNLGSGVKESVTCAPSRTVKTLKSILENLGIPNATLYDLYVDGYRLPENKRIGDVVYEYRKAVDLKLRQYPVFVHAPKGVIYRILVHGREKLAMFKKRVEMKIGVSFRDYFLLLSGLPVIDADDSNVFETPLSIGCSVFLMPFVYSQTFLVLNGDWLVKLRFPFFPQPSEIKQILLKDQNINEGCLVSIGNFLQWYFTLHTKKTGFFPQCEGKINMFFMCKNYYFTVHCCIIRNIEDLHSVYCYFV